MMIYLIIWFVSGFCSFVYWWTKDDSFTTVELPMAVFAGFIGPLAFIVGWAIHGDGNMLIKRRTK